MITFTEILVCNGTALYQTSPKQNQLSFVSSGKLSVLIAYDGMLLLQINDFQYGVNSNQQILYDDKDPQFSYIFYLKKYPQGQWILKVNENADEVFSCLNQKCYLKNKRENKKAPVENVNQRVKNKRVQMDRTQLQKKTTKTEQTQSKSLVVEASKGIGKGLSITGKYLSKGFQSLGGFISKKVEPKQKIQVKQSTKDNITLAKKTTGNVLTFTAQQVSSLFKFGKQMVKDAGQRFQSSQKGKQMQQNKYYGTVKEGAKTGATALAYLYDGVVNAVYQIGSGVSKGATKVVGAKYGKDAEQAADGVFEGAGNIAKIARIPKDEAAKAFKQ